jgi:L-iditol 2-dehydrogenase
MKALLKSKKNQLAYVDCENPVIKNPQEVLVKIIYSSFCGSDMERLKSDDKDWDSVILGHEAVGQVVKIGNEVENLKIGDKVVIIPLVPCYSCTFCISGEYALCTNYIFIGSRINGTFAEYIVVNQANLLKINNDKKIYKYVFLEPLTVALHAIYKTKFLFGDRAAILGAGTQGLLILQILKSLGLFEILITDIDINKLKIANDLKADFCINVGKKDLMSSLKDINEKDFNITFEASGSEEAKRDSLLVTGQNGTIVLIGTSPKNVMFEGNIFELITRKELKLYGSWMSYSAPFPGIEWFSAKKILDNNYINVDHMITHKFKIDEVDKINHSIFKNNESHCKIIIEM